MLGGIIVVERGMHGLNRNRATIRHSIARVHDQIDQNLFDLTWISTYPPGILTERRYQLDVFADQMPQQLVDLDNQIVEAKYLWLNDLPAGKGQQLAREVRCAPNGIAELGEVVVRRVIGRQRVDRHLGI